LLDLEKHLKKKAEWRKGIGEHSVPRESPELLLLSCARPLKLPFRRDLLSQFKGKVVHPRPESLHLHAWLLSGRGSVRNAFLHQSQKIAHLASYTIPVDCLTDFEMCEVAPSGKPF
jgi:hypothetical protein